MIFEFEAFANKKNWKSNITSQTEAHVFVANRLGRWLHVLAEWAFAQPFNRQNTK